MVQVVAIEGEQAFRRRGLRDQAGDAVGRLAAPIAGFDVPGFAAHGEDLSDAREVDAVVELAGDPDGAPLAAAVFGLGALSREARRASCDGLVESEPDVVEQGGLVALDGKQIVGVAVEQIGGQRPLGEQASAVTVRPTMSGRASSRGMTLPISLVRFSPSSASGLMPTFLSPRSLGVVTHDAQHVSLASLVISGASDGLAVDGQRAVARAVGLAPGPERGVEPDRIDADQQPAHRRQAGRTVLAIATAHAEALQHSETEVVAPFADRLVAPHAAERRGGGQRQHRGERMAPALPAAGIVDALEELGQGAHLCGGERHL